jgi:hypothetical protein
MCLSLFKEQSNEHAACAALMPCSALRHGLSAAVKTGKKTATQMSL